MPGSDTVELWERQQTPQVDDEEMMGKTRIRIMKDEVMRTCRAGENEASSTRTMMRNDGDNNDDVFSLTLLPMSL